MILLGLLLLAAAAVLAVDGVLSNLGHSHLLSGNFQFFGYHLSGSTGRLLLIGIVLGAAGMLGLNLLLAGLGRGVKRRVSNRRQLKEDKRENKHLASERDQLADQLADERSNHGASADRTVNGAPPRAGAVETDSDKTRRR